MCGSDLVREACLSLLVTIKLVETKHSSIFALEMMLEYDGILRL